MVYMGIYILVSCFLSFEQIQECIYLYTFLYLFKRKETRLPCYLNLLDDPLPFIIIHVLNGKGSTDWL